MIFLSSGWFNENQVKRLEYVKYILSLRNLSFYSPRDDGSGNASELSHEMASVIFNENIDAIRSSNLMLAVYDEEDAGVMWEIGYAYSFNIPIVVVKFDDAPINVMISESAYSVIYYSDLVSYNFTPNVYKGAIY